MSRYQVATIRGCFYSIGIIIAGSAQQFVPDNVSIGTYLNNPQILFTMRITTYIAVLAIAELAYKRAICFSEVLYLQYYIKLKYHERVN